MRPQRSGGAQSTVFITQPRNLNQKAVCPLQLICASILRYYCENSTLVMVVLPCITASEREWRSLLHKQKNNRFVKEFHLVITQEITSDASHKDYFRKGLLLFYFYSHRSYVGLAVSFNTSHNLAVLCPWLLWLIIRKHFLYTLKRLQPLFFSIWAI